MCKFAQVVGGDPDKDVAVLQLLDMPADKMQDLKPVTLGTSSTLMVGQRVYAIGAGPDLWLLSLACHCRCWLHRLPHVVARAQSLGEMVVLATVKQLTRTDEC